MMLASETRMPWQSDDRHDERTNHELCTDREMGSGRFARAMRLNDGKRIKNRSGSLWQEL